jgi:hypothetical protein
MPTATEIQALRCCESRRPAAQTTAAAMAVIRHRGSSSPSASPVRDEGTGPQPEQLSCGERPVAGEERREDSPDQQSRDGRVDAGAGKIDQPRPPAPELDAGEESDEQEHAHRLEEAIAQSAPRVALGERTEQRDDREHGDHEEDDVGPPETARE